ncbi:glycosyltransferase [Hallella sp.]|uniref:glycosyltransferase n=1 Tax=Hallella sp. TaxID=2980186 RepID=UPI00283BED96|nr:glycosyltransferase [Hallella sp.]MDR3844605.1 glycosyltransferase [Hallella sp.]
MRTRVFIFNNASRAANYGIGTYVRQLSDGLAALPDFWISFVEMYADSKEFSIVEDGKGLLHYRIPALASGIETEAYCRSIFYFIARHIEFGESDRLVFQFNYFQHYPLASLLKGQYPHSRIIVTVHYLNWCFELKGNITRMRKITANGHEAVDETERRVVSSFMDEKAFLHLADEVFVLSKSTKAILAKDYNVSQDKTHLIYNGIGNAICHRASSCHGAENAERNILFVGRLDEIKGLKYLISAFGKIAGRYPNTRLVIAGDGDFQPYLEQGRKWMGRVVFLGKMQNNELDEVYETAYIGVMPSFHEQCSYTAIEMMRHGIPIVGTDSTGLGEMLDGTPQLRVHIDEDSFNEDTFVMQIAFRLDLLLSDENAYREASDAVCRLYEKRYKVSSMAKGIQQTVLLSFERMDYTVSPDYLRHIDSRMMQLVNQRPDIDTDFFGMSGIGVYLWWRIKSLADNKEKELQQSMLQEYLIYYLDWLDEVARLSSLPEEMSTSLMDMYWQGFYKTKVRAMLGVFRLKDEERKASLPSKDMIISNSLRICNCKI